MSSLAYSPFQHSNPAINLPSIGYLLLIQETGTAPMTPLSTCLKDKANKSDKFRLTAQQAGRRRRAAIPARAYVSPIAASSRLSSETSARPVGRLLLRT
ncbi:hypothetical protein EVAR_38822_1 [Eumeta japonica]|uniref:Uncharacterized protein n=1 Tax=Eumeta variegata TaxID=151549 RepID=A0A4C1XSG8_EUMVA|nr:hypothetical protein EVAR_38822_1 [Eumeta japonica]